MRKAISSVTSTAQKEQIWRDRFVRQANSGKTIAAFCHSEAISEGGFYAWRNRLQVNGSKKALKRQSTAAAFVDLGTVQSDLGDAPLRRAVSPAGAARSGIDVRIDLGDGIVLTIARH